MMFEYFVFFEKFYFVDLCGLDVVSVLLGEIWFEFEIVIWDWIFGDIMLGVDNIWLFCMLVINLFELDV